MHIKWKRPRLLWRQPFEQAGTAWDATLVQSVRVNGKVRHRSVVHLGTLTKWGKGRESDALARRADQSLVEIPDKPGFVTPRPGPHGWSSIRGTAVLAALDRLEAHDNADRCVPPAFDGTGFVAEASAKIRQRAPQSEHTRLIANLERAVYARVGREVKAPTNEAS